MVEFYFIHVQKSSPREFVPQIIEVYILGIVFIKICWLTTCRRVIILKSRPWMTKIWLYSFHFTILWNLCLHVRSTDYRLGQIFKAESLNLESWAFFAGILTFVDLLVVLLLLMFDQIWHESTFPLYNSLKGCLVASSSIFRWWQFLVWSLRGSSSQNYQNKARGIGSMAASDLEADALNSSWAVTTILESSKHRGHAGELVEGCNFPLFLFLKNVSGYSRGNMR